MQKLSVQQLPSIFKDLTKVAYDETANKLTFTNVKGDVLEVELSPKDNFMLNASYDSTTHKTTLTYLDGTTKDLDMSDLYNIYTGVNDTQIKVEVDSDNKIKATIKNASITRNKLASDVTEELDTDKEDIEKLKKAIESINSATASDLGDKAVLPLVESAFDTWQPRGLNIEAAEDFKDEYAYGYCFTGPHYMTQNRPFNRIKVMVGVPGWCRIGIVRGTGTNQYDGVARGIYKASTTYETEDVYPVDLIPGNDGSDTTADGKKHKALKKWLVCQWVATPGLHEFDIPEEVITSPLEYVYMECRGGVSGFAMNRTGAAITTGDLTIADAYLPNALACPTQFVSKTYFGAGSYAMSNNMLDSSARIKYSSLTNAGVVKAAWDSVSTVLDTDRECHYDNEAYGWLNIGLYEKGASGVVVFQPIVENVLSKSANMLNNLTTENCMYSWVPDWEGQKILAEKKSAIYAIDLFVASPGDLTVYLMASEDPAKNYIKKCWTLRLRAIGPQRIHLPEEVVLQEGEYLGFGGCTEAVFHTVHEDLTEISDTSKKLLRGYVDTASFLYGNPVVNNFTSIGDDPTGVTDCVPYDAIRGDSEIHGFRTWRNVKLTNDTKKFDFTGAEFLGAGTTRVNIGLVTRSGRHSKIEDLNVSITGDSITTYNGIVSKTDDWGGTVNAAGNNAIFYPNAGAGHVNSPDQTWWGKFIKDNRARLIRNDAWSGSKVSGTDSATSSTACASTIRTKMLHGTKQSYEPNTTTGLAYPYGSPELIVCMIGTNDLSGGVAAGAYSNTEPTDISTILGAFEKMVARHKLNYPGAKLMYFMIPRGNTQPYPYTNANGYSISQMAAGMEYIAKAMGAYFVPLSYFHGLDSVEGVSRILFTPTGGYVHPREDGTHYTVTDRLHPNATGHALIANGLTRFIESNF